MKHSRLPGQSHRSIRTPQIRSWVTLTLPSLPTPTIIAGDLNANPWSSGMQQLVAAELHRATSLQPTSERPARHSDRSNRHVGALEPHRSWCGA
jgi:endonuclease/exonuclease/phosphatase family metal-dependent hydrolase